MNFLKLLSVFLFFGMCLTGTFAGILPNNCSHLTGEEYTTCNSILEDSTLLREQKEYLYINVLEKQGELGSFDFVWNWNKNIFWTEPPKSVGVENDGIIKDAWVKIVAVEKSYFDLDETLWFVLPRGKIFVDYSYRIEIPSEKIPGDCATHYYLEEEMSKLQTNLDGVFLGNQKISEYDSSALNKEEILFESVLEVKTRLRIVHWREKKYCPTPFEWDCYTVCEKDSTSYAENGLLLKDSFGAVATVQNSNIEIFAEDSPALKKVIIFIESNELLNGFELHTKNNSFFLSETVFDLGILNSETIFVTKKKSSSKKMNGFVEFDYNATENMKRIVLGTTELENCFYRTYLDFEKTQVPCNITYLKKPFLRIETDKNSYDFNENTVVEIILTDENEKGLGGETVFLSAGKITNSAKTETDGEIDFTVPAHETKGIIIASFKGNKEHGSIEAVKRIALNKEDTESTGINAGVFFAIYYVVFLVGKKIFTGVI
jgi:hypothetical protein